MDCRPFLPKPKDRLQNQKENQRLTQTFSNSGRWLWISVTGCFRSANGTLLKLSSLPLQVERHLSSHWLSPWGSEVKHVLGLHGSKDIYLDWTGRLLTFLAQSGHERNPLQGSELFEHGHNSGIEIWSSGRNEQLLPGMVAAYSVLQRSVSPSVFNIQVNLLVKLVFTCIGVVSLYLAGFNEVFDTGRVVLNTSKMKGSPSIVVAHVHVNASQIGSLKCHLVSLGRSLEGVCKVWLVNKCTWDAANKSWTSFRLCSS